MDKHQVLDAVKMYNVKFVNMQFVDILGMVKSVTIPAHKLEDAIDHNVWFDGSSIDGFLRIQESDMFLKPDLSTFRIIPWQKSEESSTARIICDVHTADGKPFEGDPRYVLKKVIQEAEKMGYTYYTGPEAEFNLFKLGEDGAPVPLVHDRADYFGYAMDEAEELRQDMTHALEEMGMEVEALHHEVAQGQHEIDFKYADALRTADNLVTYKYVLKAIAKMYDLHVSFMPKPIFGVNGVGMHTHQSLFKNGKNAFYDKNDSYKLSTTARQFIAGLMHHIPAICAVTNPTVNSYKRLVPGYEAPVYIAWANANRTALIRIPRITPGREAGTRVELRSPDPACNPYLAFALMLAAGLDGIKNKMKEKKPVEKNIFKFDEAEAKKHEITTLPGSLEEATKNLKESDLVRKVFGEHLFEYYVKSKEAEWNEYRLQVSKWEIDRYLEAY